MFHVFRAWEYAGTMFQSEKFHISCLETDLGTDKYIFCILYVCNPISTIYTSKKVKPGFTTYQPQPNNSRALSKMKKKQQKAIKNNITKIILINLQEEP